MGRDIDFENCQITVRDSKNNEMRHVPMNPVVVNTLKARPGIIPLVFANPRTGEPYKDVRKSLRTALKDAKITKGLTFHGLRHTAASHLIMSGVGLRTVGKILGHKTAQITLRYAHLEPEYLKGAIDKLDYSVKEDESQNAA